MKLANWNEFCPTFFGTGASTLVGEKAKEMGMKKVMLITEADLMKFGIATKVQEALEAAGLEVLVFDKVAIDPPSDICDEGGDFAIANKADGIVAVGGGSSLDTAKAVAMLTANPGPLKKYFKTKAAELKRGIPLITIPTTSGTGSENTQYAVITDVESHLKEVPEYAPDLALVDPVLTYTLPKGQTAATGMDVIAHCAEAITSAFWNPYSNVFAAEGIRLVMKWLPIAVKEPDNAEAREMMSFAANLGGMAITYCSCQFGHAWSQCFGGKFHVPHGLGCAWGFPGSMAMAGKYCPEDAKIVADAMGVTYTEKTTPDELAKMLTDKAVELMKAIEIPSLKASGYSLEDCQSVADVIPNDAAYQAWPEHLDVPEIKEYIKITYEAYQ